MFDGRHRGYTGGPADTAVGLTVPPWLTADIRRQKPGRQTALNAPLTGIHAPLIQLL
jgi:hypothetical protein